MATSQIYNVGGQIVTPDIYFQIGMGMIPGMYSAIADGYNPAIRADWETVWPTGGLYYWPTTATIINISSSSGSDTGAGIGAQQVEVLGLDVNWDRISELVTLNGSTDVPTSQQFLRVNSLRVLSAGSTGYNIGTITADHGEVGIVQTIEPQYNSSRTAILSIPSGFIVGITEFSANMVGNAAYAEIALIAAIFNEPYQVVISEILGNAGDLSISFRSPIKFNEQTDLEIICITDTGNRDSIVSASFQNIIIEENYSDLTIGF